MCFFRRKKEGYEQFQVSSERCKENINRAELLVTIADDSEIKEKLEAIVELLKYKVGPTKDEKAFKIDDKIGNKLDDVRILLSKKEPANEKILVEIKALNALIAERNVYSK